MKTVVYSCPFVPAEWVAAHGFQPQRVMPRRVAEGTLVGVTTGVCPYVQAFMDTVLAAKEASAVVMTTTCDQMRRASELLEQHSESPVFLMHVPTTWQSANVHCMYREELERLSRFLVRLGGVSPSDDDLFRQMDRYDQNRASLRAAGRWLRPRHYAELIAEFHRTGGLTVTNGSVRPDLRNVRLAILGGPMLQQDLQIFDVVEACGGTIVFDGTETGERGWPQPFDRRRLRNEPLLVLVEAYFSGIVDAFRRPNHRLYEWLRREVADRQVRGILLRRYVWCDTWAAELARLREWIQIPVLDVEIGDQRAEANVRLQNRVQAFLETLG